MLRKLKLFMVMISLLTFSLFVNTMDVFAFCVYNNSKYPLNVVGNICTSKLGKFETKIPVNGKACCPGNERCCKEQEIIVRAKNHKGEIDEKITPKKVPAHGWVVITTASGSQVKDPSYLNCKVYSEKGAVLYSGLMHLYLAY